MNLELNSCKRDINNRHFSPLKCVQRYDISPILSRKRSSFLLMSWGILRNKIRLKNLKSFNLNPQITFDRSCLFNLGFRFVSEKVYFSAKLVEASCILQVFRTIDFYASWECLKLMTEHTNVRNSILAISVLSTNSMNSTETGIHPWGNCWSSTTLGPPSNILKQKV